MSISYVSWSKAQKGVKGWNREKRITFVILLALVIAGAGLIPSRISVTLSPSLKHRIFFIKQYTPGENIKTGNYVMFMLSAPHSKNGKPQKVMKKVGCSAGEELSQEGRDFFCNGGLLGTAKKFSLKGKKLAAFKYAGTVPKDKMFLVGDHKDSYDSRYFGFVDKKDILYVAYPII